MESEWAQIRDRVPPVIGVPHSKICQLLDAAVEADANNAAVMLIPKIYVTPPGDDGDDSPTPECFSETASTITEKVRMLRFRVNLGNILSIPHNVL